MTVTIGDAAEAFYPQKPSVRCKVIWASTEISMPEIGRIMKQKVVPFFKYARWARTSTKTFKSNC